MKALMIHGTADDSIVDGPGIRFAIFTQGCSHACPGCHNPEALPFEGGMEVTVDELKRRIEDNPLLEGITLTGGEPFEQPEPLLELARWAKKRGLSVWAFSGYTYEELMGGVPSALAKELLEAVDVLVDGRYVQALASHELTWRGSSNQRIIEISANSKLI
ncbi:MAG: anaerobic ribonucleoside-triphosphate reductase activating protein [Coriobacteriia bacterium]|nr:anaerobic ribonucleoside-triphosphate reductase activating protein [Coriobacteriia bacterium]